MPDLPVPSSALVANITPGDTDMATLSSSTGNLAAGVLLSPIKGLQTSEDGRYAEVRARLTAAPTADVTISLASDNELEGLVSAPQLVFTAANWKVPQRFRVTGQSDGVIDGNKIYKVITGNTVSADPNYNGLDVPDITLTNVDSKKLVAGFTVSKTSGLTTTEIGGKATFTVKLNYKPTADVTILVASDAAEGKTNVKLLVFTTKDWNLPQTVTVTGQQDGEKDGNKTYHVNLGPATSDDPLYKGMAVPRVTLTNRDSRIVAGIIASPAKGLTTTELGGTASFMVTLNYMPTEDVTVAVASNDLKEGTTDVSSLTFTSGDWNVARMVTVTGQPGNGKNGDVAYHVILGPATSDDSLYRGKQTVVKLTNRAAVRVSSTSLVTTEDGGSAFYTLVLVAPPTANVTIPIDNSDPAVTANVKNVTFTPLNWNRPQYVFVTGYDSPNHTGGTYSIVNGPATSDDPRFDHLLVQDVSVTNLPSIRRFDGSYSGPYKGTVSVYDPVAQQSNFKDVSGNLSCVIANGKITASIDDPEGGFGTWTATGTVDQAGYVRFAVKNGATDKASFNGSFIGSGPNISFVNGWWSLFDSDNGDSGSGSLEMHLVP